MRGFWQVGEMSPERFLKTLHGWLGFLILPWVVLAGLTGLYENHGDLFHRLLPQAELGPGPIEALPSRPVDAAGAAALATRILSGPTGPVTQVLVFKRPSFEIAGEETLRVDAATGAYWREGQFAISLYAPDGRELASRINWSKLLVRLHRAGWPGDRFGTWPADIAAAALVVFGVSGLYLFIVPRLRRWKNRRRQRSGRAA